MPCGLIRSLLIAVVAVPVMAYGGEGPAARLDPAFPEVLQRFLSLDDASPIGYRALRHLEARNGQSRRTAWMDVWTEADDAGRFTYDVVADGGSGLIRSKVFVASLEMEKKMYGSRESGRAALTPENYVFEQGETTGGLSALTVTPRRKDVLLIDGSIFLRPEDGDLVRLEGRLSKAPSFWIGQVMSSGGISGSRVRACRSRSKRPQRFVWAAAPRFG
jgi:hypothetical protein